MGQGNTLTAWLFATAMELCVIAIAGFTIALILSVPDTTTNVTLVILTSLVGALLNITIEI
jgi:hypothetical protein